MNTSNITHLPIHNSTQVYDSTQIGIIYAVTSPLVMLSNLIVIVVVVKSQDLHLPTMWNIAYMSVCDFLYGLHYMVFAVPSAFLKQFAYSNAMIGPASCVLTLLYGQNILNIMVATIDRYLSICWPMKYSRLMSSKRFLLANVITCVINIIRLCLIVLPDMDVFYNPYNAVAQSRFLSLVGVGASIILPFIVVMGISGIIIRIMRELYSSKLRIHPPYNQSNDARSLTMSVALSAGVFVLSYAPSCTAIIWNIVCGLESIPPSLITFATFCLLSNSLWNVAIYALIFKPFKRACLQLFCPRYYRKLMQREMMCAVVQSNNCK